MKINYYTLIITFGKSIEELNKIFDNPQTWGASSLKEWIDYYESTRFTQISNNTAVITSEYNMELVVGWLQENAPITEQKYV